MVEKHRVSLVLHLRDLTVQLAARVRVQARGRLVQEHQLGLVDEGEGQRQPLTLAARQRLERCVSFVEEREAFEKRCRFRLLTIERAEERQGLARRDLVLQCRRLQRRADFLLHFTRPAPGIDAADVDCAFVRFTQSDDTLDRRRLAGAVGADESEDLAVSDLEADAARRFDAAVAFLEILDGDFWWHCFEGSNGSEPEPLEPMGTHLNLS